MARLLSYVTFISAILLFFLACEKGEDTPGPVTDIDGNVYETVKIGSQVWMAENLKTTRFSDGTQIELVSDSLAWHNTFVPAFSWYNNDSAIFKVPYGALYNGYSAENENICPDGWHLPDNEEWSLLIEFLGGIETAGGKLKVTGTTDWHYPNSGADNSSLFTALPAGIRYFEGTFSSLSYFTAFWSGSEADTSSLNYLSLSYLDAISTISSRSKKYGFSIRCIKN